MPYDTARAERVAMIDYTYQVQGDATLYLGDALEVVRTLPSESVNCVVTSPPYYFMRDYGVEGQYGLENTPQAYVDTLRGLFREIRRVLTADGTAWLNVGDAYSQRKAVRMSSHQEGLHGVRAVKPTWVDSRAAGMARMSSENVIDGTAIPEKSLMMLPERLVVGMIEDGWILRNRITWDKSFSIPDPTRDRFKARTEPVFFFSKSRRYFFDAPTDRGDIWRIAPSSGADTHTASFPPDLARRCILAGCPEGGTVLDPFSGSGTTGMVALEQGKKYVGIDLNPEYLDLSLRTRLRTTT